MPQEKHLHATERLEKPYKSYRFQILKKLLALDTLSPESSLGKLDRGQLSTQENVFSAGYHSKRTEIKCGCLWASIREPIRF